MNIRENLIIDIETDVSDNESSFESLKFLVDEDLKDLGYNVHSLQVQPAKRHPDSNGVLNLTEKELIELNEKYLYDFSEYRICPQNHRHIIEGYREGRLSSWWKIYDYRITVYLDKLFELGGK